MLAPNTLLQDRYLVMRLLGQGGMGAVYQATDRKFGSAVALKETFYSDDQLRKAFSQEARLLNRLRHAALPVVMDYFAIGDRQFLVMQYIPGQDLEQLLAERRSRGQGVFLASQVLLWADQLLDALEYLHSQKPPIIHRDIKPQNLKLTPRGEVILLDFGLAKGVTNQQNQDSQSIRGYTPNYASLEQIRGTGTDARSDIYSIGATLYHLLTGEMPQDAMTRIAAMLMGHRDPLRPINEVNPEVPQVVAGVIERAMTPHPDKRYPSAAIMRQALRNASRNIPTSNLHRVPTLTDVPMKSKVAAAAAAAVAYDPKSQPNPKSEFPKAVEEQEPSTDHYILLLEERKQEVLKRANQYRKGSNARRSPSARKGARGKRAGNLMLPFSRPVLYGGVAIAMIVMTVAAWLFNSKDFQNRFPGTSATFITELNKRPPNPVVPANTLVAVESLRYFLELNPGTSERVRATGLKPLLAGSKFSFHFRPRDNGYIYLLALGTGGSIQTFLTDQPLAATGVTSNRIEAGRDFQFPGNGVTFQIQNDSETTPFTVILSPRPLKTPAFLAALSGRDLNDAEQKELAEFKKRYATKAPEVVAIVDNDQPIVTVHVPSDRPTNQPLIFDITIKRSK
jgi:serine/threonine protein kinase